MLISLSSPGHLWRISGIWRFIQGVDFKSSCLVVGITGDPSNVSGSPFVISNLLGVDASDDAIGWRRLTHVKDSLRGEDNAQLCLFLLQLQILIT